MATEREIPEGYRLDWVPEGDNWKLADREMTCRSPGCPNQAAAALRRSHALGINGYRWWYYCADHLYGRKIEDGVVKYERLVELESTR